MAGFYSLPVIRTLDAIGGADIVAVIDEMDMIAGYESAPIDAVQRERALSLRRYRAEGSTDA